MDRNELLAYCLTRPAAIEDFPFGADVSVLKVMGKMFALIPVNGAASISLKCEPTLAEILRQTYPAVTPGYHLNKKHWNSVAVDGSIPDDEIHDMIDASYDLVVKSLTKAQREELKADSAG